MKKIIAIILSALFLTACAPSNKPMTFSDFGVVDGNCRNGTITTPYGHNWKVNNMGDYTGPVEVTIDAKGTSSVADDEIMFIVITDK